MTDIAQFPIDLHNEQVILGQAFNFLENRELFLAYVGWDHFLEKKHRVIAWCIGSMCQQQLEINDDSLLLVLDGYPDLDREYGGNTYIARLRALSLSKNNNFEQHLTKLKSDHVKATVAREGLIRVFQQLNNPHATVEEIIAGVESVKISVEQGRLADIDFAFGQKLYSDYLKTLRSRVEKSSFVTTGFQDLDEVLTEGMCPGNVSLITGFTGMAKSSFVHNCALRQIGSGLNVGIVSIEMMTASVLDRQISIATSIPVTSIVKKTADLTRDEKLLIDEMMRGIRDHEKLFINDQSTITLDQIDLQLSLLRRLGKPIDVLYIDLFGKLDDVSVQDNLAMNIERKMRITRAIARKQKTHISCVVQLKRYFDMNTIRPNRPVPRPKLDKIKNSGAFAEEVDLLFLLHRNKYYKPDVPHDILEVEVAKQRQGQMNVVKYFGFEDSCTRITSTSLRPDDLSGDVE